MSLITRILPPDAKGSKLTFQEMDNNLYYLQSLGVSGLTFSANTLTITNPTGGTVASTTLDINVDNRWFIPSGTTIEIDSFSQSFVYGDLYVLGQLILNENSQLIILNGDLILSGGTISGSGQTVLVDLPTFGDLISSGSYSGGTLTLSTSNGSDVTINGFFTGSTDVYTTGATYNDGIIYFDTNVSQSAYTVNISSLTGDSNTFLTASTYDSSTNTITLTDNTNNSLNTYINGFSGLTINGILSAATYQNLPDNVTGNYLPLSGGTVTGSTSFTNGLTANTLSATTLQSSNTYIESTGYLYFGDSSTDGSWRMSISGVNFIVEKRVGGNWIISGTFN